jgi:Xaa-Pro aminopeptidase
MSSRPHYVPQARPIGAGDLLLIDMGLVHGGYCSDMTRTVAVGRKPAARLVKAYSAVLEAQLQALDAVGPGIACAELDRIARASLKARKLARYFTHGLGHGVGLEIHEAPTLNGRSKEILRAGMVITIEPGVYLPGLGGIRIEDLVLVTRTGHKVLSRTPKQFQIIPF